MLPPESLEEASMPRQQDLLQGTLDMLILRILSVEPMHGWGITQRVEQMSDEVLQVQQGSLYPAMERLGRKGWVTSEWRTRPITTGRRVTTALPERVENSWSRRQKIGQACQQRSTA